MGVEGNRGTRRGGSIASVFAAASVVSVWQEVGVRRTNPRSNIKRQIKTDNSILSLY